MAINLGNVNISLRQFQEISSGKYNAGEVKLTSETAIDKVNNHVTMKFLNSTKISHEEVLAIKNAFIKALKSGGVNTDEINRIRQELGLAPMKPVDRNLHERSIKPLSRQQIREILDRNKANAELNTRRDVIENKAIYNLQSVLAGDVDFTSANDRKELLAMARRCLDAVLVDCNASPRDNFRPVIHWTSPGGTDLAFPTGLTEKALVRKLEDIIVRLAILTSKGGCLNGFRRLCPKISTFSRDVPLNGTSNGSLRRRSATRAWADGGTERGRTKSTLSARTKRPGRLTSTR